jgi:DNA-binding transcriptional MerR regulator/mannose-6-phosphate isomerase-like protein (cupin superfamily)
MDKRYSTLPGETEKPDNNGSRLGLPIGVVSQKVGVSPQTLRVWEREGLIIPRRSEGGTRYYGEADLERLRQIMRLRTAYGLNFAAIRRELGNVDDPPLPNGSDGDGKPREVGERLRKLRLRSRMTLKEVAEKTGLSVSFLSSLERGHTGASIASLRAVMTVFDVDWREFFEAEPRVRSRLVGPEDRLSVRWPNGIRMEDLATVGSLMDPAFLHLPPDTGSGDYFSHDGEEFIYVISGTLFVALKDEPDKTYRLRPRDCLYFPSTVRHLWWTEDEEAEIIHVNSPPSF